MPTFQDFRNDVQEMFFKELNYMNRSGDTRSCNVLQTVMNKLDYQYGTRYEKTALQFEQEALRSTKKRRWATEPLLKMIYLVLYSSEGTQKKSS